MCPSCFDGEWSALTFAIEAPLVEVRAVAWSEGRSRVGVVTEYYP
jgi:hypothetical protein